MNKTQTYTTYLSADHAKRVDASPGATKFMELYGSRNDRVTSFAAMSGDVFAVFDFAARGTADSLAFCIFGEECSTCKGAGCGDCNDEGFVQLHKLCRDDSTVREVLDVLALFAEMGGDEAVDFLAGEAFHSMADYQLCYELDELRRAAVRDGHALSIWEVKAIDALLTRTAVKVAA